MKLYHVPYGATYWSEVTELYSSNLTEDLGGHVQFKVDGRTWFVSKNNIIESIDEVENIIRQNIIKNYNDKIRKLEVDTAKMRRGERK